jgi:hypothetical protein
MDMMLVTVKLDRGVGSQIASANSPTASAFREKLRYATLSASGRAFDCSVIGDIVRWRSVAPQIVDTPRHAVSLICSLCIGQTRYCLGLADQPKLGG